MGHGQTRTPTRQPAQERLPQTGEVEALQPAGNAAAASQVAAAQPNDGLPPTLAAASEAGASVATTASAGSLRRRHTSYQQQASPDGGVVRRRERSDTREVSVAEPSFGRTRERTSTHTDAAADARFTDTQSSTTGVSLEDGGPGVAASTRSRSEIADAEGNVVHADEREQSAQGGAMWNQADGWGARGGVSRRTREERGGTTRERTTGGGVQVQANRVGGNLETSGTARRGNLEATHRASVDGSFRIDLQPRNDADPPYYLLTFTASLSASAGGTAGRAPRGEGARGPAASVGVQGSAGGSMTTTRRLTPTEAQAYLEEADRRERGQGTARLPEFGRLDRLQAAAGNADALANGTAALGSASTARQMADGEAVQLDLNASIGASGSASYGGNSVQAGAQAAWRRTARVERVQAGGRDIVRVTVGFSRDTSWNAGGTASAAGASAGGSYSENAQDAEQVRVDLDPTSRDYDAIYGRVLAADSPSSLRTIAAREDVGRRVTERTTTTGQGSSVAANASGGGLGGSFGSSASQRETRTQRGDQVEYQVHGEHRGSLGASVGGLQVVDWDNTNTADADVNGEGVSLDLRQDEASNLGEGAPERERDTSDAVGQALSQSPLERLRSEVAEQHHHLRGLRCTPEDIEVLVQRAGNDTQWSMCCNWIELNPRWRAVGATLRAHARVPTQEAARLRRNLVIARALTGFVSGNGAAGSARGDEARRTFENAMRYYGQDRNGQGGGAARGTRYEFPPSIASAAETYDRLRGEVGDLEGAARRVRARDGDEAVAGMFRRVQSGLERVRGQVEGCRDFESPSAKSELMREINDHLDQVARARGAVGASAAEPGSTPEPREERRLEWARVERLKRTLRGNKREETRMLARMQENLNSFFGSSQDLFADAFAVHELHVSWRRQIVELRDAYTDLGVPSDDWQVSSGPRQPRKPALEPDMARLLRYYLSMANRSMAGGNAQDTAATWRREHADY